MKRVDTKHVNRVSDVIKRRIEKALDSKVKPKKLNCCDLYKLDVGREHRLVSKDRVKWILLTHEKYNKYIKSH